MGKRVNQVELAEIIGKSDVTIWEWQKDGLPIAKRGERGTENEYDTAEVIAWLESRAAIRAGKGESQRDREARLRGDLMELELAQKRESLVPADKVLPMWEGFALAAAFYMTSRHSRLAGMLEAAVGIEAKRALLKKEDAEFLNRLGVEFERMEQEVQRVLERLGAEDAAAFLRRVAGHDDHRGDGGTQPASS